MTPDTGPPQYEGGPGVSAEARPSPLDPYTTDKVHDTAATSSQQVSFWSVHEHVAPTLAQVQSWPTLGSPAWCALGDDDPAKLAALLDAAQHWALRLETCQQARADASREISDAVDWSAVAREVKQLADFYAAKPWLRRVTT